MAAIDWASSCAPHPNSQSPPIAHAPNPTGVMSRSESPRALVFIAFYELIQLNVQFFCTRGLTRSNPLSTSQARRPLMVRRGRLFGYVASIGLPFDALTLAQGRPITLRRAPDLSVSKVTLACIELVENSGRP